MPAPLTVTTRNSAGVSGADRVELIWNSGAVTQKWLEVTVLANANTGLAAADHFFFGSEIGDANKSNTATVFKVGASDTTATQIHVASLGTNQPITNIFDFNRDGQVGAGDITIDQIHTTNLATGLQVITIAGCGPFAPVPAAAVSGNAGMASALAGTSPSTTTTPTIPAWVVNRLSHLDLNHGPIAKYFERLSHENTAKSRAILVKADQVADALDLDDTLLDSLLVKLGLE